MLRLPAKVFVGSRFGLVLPVLAKVTDPEMNSYPRKEVILNGERLEIHGVTNDDGYFASIDSNFETEFCELCNRLILARLRLHRRTSKHRN